MTDVKFYLYALAVAVLGRVFWELVPSVLAPVQWERPNDLPTLDGLLAPNEVLTQVQRKTNGFAGPECIAFHPVTGVGYGEWSIASATCFFLHNVSHTHAQCR